MPADTPSTAHDRGETLIELIIAVAIMSIAMVAIVGSLGTSILMSDVHRKQSTAGAYVRDYAEAIENNVATSGYVATCSPNYASSFVVPASYAATITAVSFWDGSTFPATCNAATDLGIQQLTLKVNSSDNRAAETLVIVVRKPCGPGSAC